MTYAKTHENNCPSIFRVVRCELPDGTITTANEGTMVAKRFGVSMPVRFYESTEEKARRLLAFHLPDEDAFEMAELCFRLMWVL